MRTPSIRRTLLLRCGFGVGILLSLLSTGTYLIVRHGLIRELDRSITQTAALLSNQVELEDGGSASNGRKDSARTSVADRRRAVPVLERGEWRNHPLGQD